MSLHIRQTSSRKSQLIVTLFAAFALVAQPLYGFLQVRVAYADANPITQISFESEPQTVTDPAPLATPERVSPGDSPVKGAGLMSDWSDVTDATSYVYQRFNLDGNGNCDLSSQRGNDETFTESHSSPTDEAQSYCWRVMAKSTVNASNWSQAWKVTVDNDPPTVTLDPIGTVGGKDADENDVNSVAFTGSVNDTNGISGYIYRLLDTSGGVLQGPFSSGAPTSTTLGSLDISGLEGNYIVQVTATDVAGNMSAPVNIAFTIDRTAPDLSAQVMNSATFMASTEPIVLQGTVGLDFKSLTLMRKETNEAIDLTGSVDENGNWAYVIPKDEVTQGSYNFSLTVTDALSNVRTVLLAPISVSAFIPGMGSGLPTDLTKSLTDSFIVPRPLASSLATPFVAPTQTTSGESVLGMQTTKTPSDASNLPSVATTAEGWKFFGIAWYWWTLIAVGVGGMSWWTVVTFRRKGELV